MEATPGVSKTQDAQHFHRPKYGVLNVWNDPYGIYGCDSRRLLDHLLVPSKDRGQGGEGGEISKKKNTKQWMIQQVFVLKHSVCL